MTRTKQPLTIVPPAVFSATLRANRARAARDRVQNSLNNDGRTGFIVDYPLWLFND